MFAALEGINGGSKVIDDDPSLAFVAKVCSESLVDRRRQPRYSVARKILGAGRDLDIGFADLDVFESAKSDSVGSSFRWGKQVSAMAAKPASRSTLQLSVVIYVLCDNVHALVLYLNAGRGGFKQACGLEFEALILYRPATFRQRERDRKE
ncbi:hypothetical protein [Wenzhouxiangella sp. EGI_FJ10409]|uniref:hypothetical protein n=1 Tax=Wenzhouxiangella sp. EGI_FJ10409 TaxID=3243767 RepID=UPI0035D67773